MRVHACMHGSVEEYQPEERTCTGAACVHVTRGWERRASSPAGTASTASQRIGPRRPTAAPWSPPPLPHSLRGEQWAREQAITHEAHVRVCVWRRRQRQGDRGSRLRAGAGALPNDARRGAVALLALLLELARLVGGAAQQARALALGRVLEPLELRRRLVRRLPVLEVPARPRETAGIGARPRKRRQIG